MTDIDQSTALALLHEGLAIIPTAGQGEKRPFGQWKQYQSRLPAEDEVRRWFLSPRPGGIVCGTVYGNLEVLDLDTKESFAAFAARFGGDVPCEASPHGGHAWYRCDEIGRNGKPADKVDTRGEGGFCVCYEPQALLAQGVPRIAPEKRAELFAGVSGKAGEAGPSVKAAPGGTVRDSLIAAGWKPLGVHGNREDFSRPGAAHPGRCDASLFEGQSLKVWSTAAQSVPAPEPVRPSVRCAEELLASDEGLPEPILPFVRRGSVASLSGDPKAGKTWLACRMALKAAAEGRVVAYCDLENGARLFAHRLRNVLGRRPRSAFRNIHYADCTEDPTTACIAASLESIGRPVDLLFVDPLGLLFAGDGVEDESSNALVSAWFLRFRREVVRRFGCATVILHHQPKSGANEKLCFAGAGASSLQRYVQSIARIREDKSGNFWFEALCREFDEPFKPFVIRKAPPPP